MSGFNLPPGVNVGDIPGNRLEDAEEASGHRRPLYREIASLLQAIRNCRESRNREWLSKHQNRLAALCGRWLPSGAGIDNGTKLDEDDCNSRKLVFCFSYHHMDEMGGYCGWTDHRLIVTPSFDGIDLRITGPDKRGIKEMLYDEFYHALTREVPIC